MNAFREYVEKNNFFGYDTISKPMWHDKFKEAKELSKVHFDLENDDAVSERVISIPQDDDKCTFHCQMRKAGGDWQQSSIYFRCQLWHGSTKDIHQYSNPHFCFIPDKHQGNLHLTKTKKDVWLPPDSGSKEDIEPNERQCWASLKKYLEKLTQWKH